MAKVLIVDDSRLSVMALHNMLNRLGHDVVAQAFSGTEAIKKFKEFKPQVVTLDFVMPDINGVEVCKELNQLDPSAKIIMITTDYFPENLRQQIKVHAYVQKPITIKKLEVAFQDIE